MSTPTPKIPRPAGVLLLKSAGGGRGSSSGATDASVFAIFPNGLIRRATKAELTRWDDVTIDYTVPLGQQYDGEWLDVATVDNAIRKA
ncbi:hypothetical protein [Streptomyces sp. NBC_01264]|uniref:hypothetical protein n=1 Tax=Streptomyces sp. NBC_01264 TaxID=2903804 RepID=UPI0022580BC0|nr:hypothetical protein [Streptomyces sp. NBC_01264]MCX4778181.1 hypothetical protein [Streptomyces sp. NBC_01264]